jgi:hypothetical protein
MKRYLPVLCAGLCLLLGLALAVCGLRDRGPIYSVAAIQARLARHPDAWVGRTLLVRGVAVAPPCAQQSVTVVLCGPLRFALRDPDPAAAPLGMALAWAGSDSLLTSLRRVPFVGSIVPAPQAIRWDVVAVYRVRFRALAGRSCGVGCYAAVVLDAAP